MDYEELLLLVSEPRLTYYQQYLNCSTEWEKVGTYFAFQELSSHFLPLIQMVEVGLRNAINTAAKEHFNNEQWYLTIPVSDKSKAAVIYANNKANIECDNATPDDVVARLTFGFWVYMLDASYRNTNNRSFIWNQKNRGNVFPNAKSPWGTDLTVAAIFDELQKVLKLRNRLFHHEPIWKKHNCNSLSKAVDNVRKDYDFLLKVLNFISPVKHTLTTIMESPNRFYEECNLKSVTHIVQKLNPKSE